MATDLHNSEPTDSDTTPNRSRTAVSDPPWHRPIAAARRAASVLLHSAAFIAVVAGVETLIATVLFGVPRSPAPAVVALVAFAVYANDRVADAETDLPSNPAQATYARRHGDLLATAAALAYALAVALSLTGGPLALALTLLPGLCWVAYASRWLPGVASRVPRLAGHVPRLKDVLVLNSAVVALAWAAALTFLPLAFASDAGLDRPSAVIAAATADVAAATVAVVFVYFLLRSFVDVEVPNVRDVESDAAIGVSTLATALGLVGTRRVLFAVDLAVVSLLLAAALGGLLVPAHAGALIAGVTFSLGVTAFVGRTENVRLLAVAPEGSYLVVALVLLVVGT